jgi:hypothetical protein
MTESRPEESVPRIQRRPRPFTFEHRDLLPKGEDFEGRVGPAPEEDADHSEDTEDEFGHELTVVAWRNLPGNSNGSQRNSLTALRHGVLATDSRPNRLHAVANASAPPL